MVTKNTANTSRHPATRTLVSIQSVLIQNIHGISCCLLLLRLMFVLLFLKAKEKETSSEQNKNGPSRTSFPSQLNGETQELLSVTEVNDPFAVFYMGRPDRTVCHGPIASMVDTGWAPSSL
jgi:hypothetical protein